MIRGNELSQQGLAISPQISAGEWGKVKTEIQPSGPPSPVPVSYNPSQCF